MATYDQSGREVTGDIIGFDTESGRPIYSQGFRGATYGVPGVQDGMPNYGAQVPAGFTLGGTNNPYSQSGGGGVGPGVPLLVGPDGKQWIAGGDPSEGIQGPGGYYFIPLELAQQRAAASNKGGMVENFLNGPGPVMLLGGALGAYGAGLIGGGAGAVEGAGATGAGAGGGSSYFGAGAGGLPEFNPYALTGPATTGAEGGLITGAPWEAGTLTGPATTAGLSTPYFGAPYQPGYNWLDPSTYSGTYPGMTPGMPGAPPGSPGGSGMPGGLPGGIPGVPGGGGGGPGGAGAGGNPLSSLAGMGAGLYDLLRNPGGVDPAKLNYLWQAGVDTYNTARDPQQALYGRTVQQLQDQTRAGQSARGTAMSPFGAAGEADVMKNFNIDWNNNQLNRQLGGLQGLTQASGGYFGQQNLAEQMRQAQLQSGTNALLTGINQGMAPGGWMNSMWNMNGTPTPAAPPSANYFGGTPDMSFQNPGFNMFDQGTYYGGAGY